MRRIRLFPSAVAAIALAGGLLTPPSAHAAGVRIYPLGDSITWGTAYRYGTGTNDIVPMPGGYRGVLSGLLTAESRPHEFVGTNTENPLVPRSTDLRHNGHRGYRILDTTNALDGRAGNGKGDDLLGYWLTGQGSRPPIFPDVTVIHLGTNDIGLRHDPSTRYPTSTGLVNYGNAVQRATFLANAAGRLQVLVDKVQTLRPDTAIVLSTILPVTDEELSGPVAEYNELVRDLAASEAGQGVVLADPWAAFTDSSTGSVVVKPGLISPDTAHPTPAGYALLATVLHEAVVATGAWS